MSLRAMRPPSVIACDVNVARPLQARRTCVRDVKRRRRFALDLDVVDDRARPDANVGHGVGERRAVAGADVALDDRDLRLLAGDDR